MRTCVLVAALLATMLRWAGAQPPPALDEVTFYTYPSGAEVWVHGLDNPIPGLHNSYTSAARESFVGLSGQPVRLDLRPFQDSTGRLTGLVVTFKLAHHQDTPTTPDQDLVNRKRWPQTGVISLQPENAWIGLLDFVGEHPLRVGSALLLLALTALYGLKRRADTRRLEVRLHRLEGLTARADRNDPYITTRVGPYLLVDRLGAGGMAVVYKAVPDDTLRDSRGVAVKLISPSCTEDPEFRERFVREVRACKDLDHPNIVRLVDWGDGDPMYLAMELVDGVTLRSRVVPAGLPPEELVRLLHPMLDGMAHAHSRGIIHRDLKPENVMITRQGRVKIMDFGLARSQHVSTRLTATGTAMGTPAYMSPEQLDGATAASSDQYALGTIAYELLAGRLPFEGDTMSILFQHLTEDPPPLSQFRPGLPSGLEAIVMRMIQRQPEQRYPHLAAVLEDLERQFPELRQSA